MPYSGENCQKTLISKKKKQAPGSEEGNRRLMLWNPSSSAFCLKGQYSKDKFDWKGIWALLMMLATWGEGVLLHKSQFWGLGLVLRFLKWFDQLRECSGLWHFLIMWRLDDASYRVISVLWGYERSSSFLVASGFAQGLVPSYLRVVQEYSVLSAKED